MLGRVGFVLFGFKGRIVRRQLSVGLLSALILSALGGVVASDASDQPSGSPLTPEEAAQQIMDLITVAPQSGGRADGPATTPNQTDIASPAETTPPGTKDVSGITFDLKFTYAEYMDVKFCADHGDSFTDDDVDHLRRHAIDLEKQLNDDVAAQRAYEEAREGTVQGLAKEDAMPLRLLAVQCFGQLQLFLPYLGRQAPAVDTAKPF